MRTLSYLLIVVVGLAFAAGIMGCKPKEEPEGEPPDYECEACGEVFASTAELEEHVPICGSEPPDYECEACELEWGVADFGGYKEHMEAEHGKPFICEEEVTKPSGEVGPCGAAFADENDLTAHKNAEHAGGE